MVRHLLRTIVVRMLAKRGQAEAEQVAMAWRVRPSVHMPPVRTSEASGPAHSPQSSQERPPSPAPGVEIDPTSQSPDQAIEFTSGDEVARGNAERANAEPEPAALHAAEVPGKPDVAQRRRDIQHRNAHHDDN